MSAATSALRGKNALVTGSTSGIGLGVARALAREGVNILLNGFGSEAEIKTIVTSIEKDFGVRVAHSGANVAVASEIREMIRFGETTLGSIDILVNNAGIQHVAPIDEFPEEKWDAIIAINLSSNFHAVKAVLPGMKKRGWGRIVNIASAHGLVASPFKGAYVAAKHGVLGLTKTVALELADTEITCNSICPGYVRTPLVEKQIEQQAKVHNLPVDQVVRDVILAAQPKKKFVEVEEIAAMVSFLCSPAATAITGSSFSMDGGWTAR